MVCPVAVDLEENLACGKAYVKSALSHMDNSSSSVSYQLRLAYHERSIALVKTQQIELQDHKSQCIMCLKLATKLDMQGSSFGYC
jgi:hypothetical protein